jgi:hypothetical protein
MSLADARKEAKKLLTEEPTKHSTMTFAAACDEYTEAIKAKKPRTQRDHKRILDKYLLPKLGKRKLSEIECEDVSGIAAKLKVSEKSHCLAVARTFLRWCVQPPRRYIPHSPLEGVKVGQGSGRKRVLKPDELKKGLERCGDRWLPVWHHRAAADPERSAERRGSESPLAVDQRKGPVSHVARVGHEKRSATHLPLRRYDGGHLRHHPAPEQHRSSVPVGRLGRAADLGLE